MREQPDPRPSRSIAERVRDFWHDEGAAPRPGVTLAELRRAETNLGVRLPAGIASFFRTGNGTQGTSGDLFEAWPLERIGPVPDVLDSSGGSPDYRRIGSTLPDATEYFVFADAMIWSQVLAVRVGGSVPTEVVWISGASFAVVAPTFEAFWERYLENPDAVVWAIGSAAGSPKG